MRRRGMVRLARRKAERRLAVFGCMRSASLAVKRMLFQKRIVFFLFQPVRGARALLVSRRHITRNRFAQSLSLSAFQCDNFLRHLATLSPPPARVVLPQSRALLLLRLNRT